LIDRMRQLAADGSGRSRLVWYSAREHFDPVHLTPAMTHHIRQLVATQAAASSDAGDQATVRHYNAFGPLHLVPADPSFVDPMHFRREGAGWSDDYQLIPVGLKEPSVIQS
jgi:hypothetical protein